MEQLGSFVNRGGEPVLEIDPNEDLPPENITVPYDPSKTVIDTNR